MIKTISDKMKDNITAASNIKVKLINNGIWSANNISKAIQENVNVQKIIISENEDMLYIHMDESVENIDMMDSDIYSKITKYTNSVITQNRDRINSILDKTERKYINEYGINLLINHMYTLFPLKDRSIIACNI